MNQSPTIISPPKFLMCRPDFFSVSYEINPWMKGNIGKTVHQTSRKQWESLYRLLKEQASVELLTPQKDLPDLVFTANAGLVLDNNFILSSFAFKQRKPEEEIFREWFTRNGFQIHTMPEHLNFEGAGDALFNGKRDFLWAAYGSRSALKSHAYIAEILQIEVVSLRLIDPRFYHLDTCFLPLSDGSLVYFPEAFDMYSNRQIEDRIPKNKRIKLSPEDALGFAANGVEISKTIIMSVCSSELRRGLQDRGFEVIPTPLTEFIKSGGSAKCLTLRLDENYRGERKEKSGIVSREIVMEGQLIDSPLLSRYCDSLIDEGGAFAVRELSLGQKRSESSTAILEITAPDNKRLEKMVQRSIKMGGSLGSEGSGEVSLKKVSQAGVAPDDFYCTSIYPTQIIHQGKTIEVENLRMDGVIVVAAGRAFCTLIRDLKKNDRVVTGNRGIKVIVPSDKNRRQETFCFMGSSASSERRAEQVIEHLAWEMRRLKNSRGKIIVLAGPAVVHTGGAHYLAEMIKNGYVNGFLGGNAVAVHDIEQSLFGTSLGLDLQTGCLVEGGHRNHLRAINEIRKVGSIRQAVKKGIVKSGIFYELIKNNVPFSLAGSIRDDGPLPETQMDLIAAQADYARLIKGADMILMLSSMLHSIGTGNMTPAGVRLICVDISPSVITKLNDRGSLEATGIITDTGLFLAMLGRFLKIKEES